MKIQLVTLYKIYLMRYTGMHYTSVESLLMKQQQTHNMRELFGYLKSPMRMALMMCSMMRLNSCSCCVMKLYLTISTELAVSSTIFSRSKSQWSILLTGVFTGNGYY